MLSHLCAGLSRLVSLCWLCLKWLDRLPIAHLAPLTNLEALQLKNIDKPPGGNLFLFAVCGQHSALACQVSMCWVGSHCDPHHRAVLLLTHHQAADTTSSTVLYCTASTLVSAAKLLCHAPSCMFWSFVCNPVCRAVQSCVVHHADSY